MTLKLKIINFLVIALSPLIGVYLITLFMAVVRLLFHSKGLTIETVFNETLFGSIVMFWSILYIHLLPYLFYIIIGVTIDLILSYGSKFDRKKIIFLEMAIYTLLICAYAIKTGGLIILFLPIFIVFTQWIRLKYV